ncbi:MAG TPA: triose-phosphate isomerase [bacterium]
MSARTPLIAGNWKLNLTLAESVALAAALRDAGAARAGREVIVAPVFTAIDAVARALRGSDVKVAAQDVYWEERGAFTGAVSTSLLFDAGATAVIVGHSERRQLFGETDGDVNRKTLAVLRGGLLPIVCVGETLAEREAGAVEAVVGRQVRGALAGVAGGQVAGLALAYEPVWAIGTGRTATPAQANEAHAHIRGLISGEFGATVAARVRVLYGGSVTPATVDELMSEPEIDGVLVGGASLKAETFLKIVNFRA